LSMVKFFFWGGGGKLKYGIKPIKYLATWGAPIYG